MFVAASAAALGALLFIVVVRPAVERGGVGELIGLAVVFFAILVGERWLRTR